uniref:Centriole, cilia and spindle associated protein n=1 Tax=Monodelphis domestica TaxID=13616 RepID=F7CAY2_MONDO
MHCGSKVKSEYMKRYKDPKWDTCGPCYRELLHYRLSRRLLEQTHNPWLWDGWGPSSNSDDSSSSGGEGEELGVEEKGAEASEDEDAASPPEKDKQQMEVKKEQIEVKDKLMDNTDHPRQRALLSGADKKTAKSPQRPSKTKEVKHPFALYGWGEKQTDTGSQKTHNVCASAPEQQIHESALRAKNRRQVEKRKLVNQRQRAYSVDVQKPRRSKPSSSDSPWMTEYMRCYSARA